MKKSGIWLLLAASLPSFAQTLGSVVTSCAPLIGDSGNYALTFYWTASSSSGLIPTTPARLGDCPGSVQGYRLISVTTAPGVPAPTNAYSMKLLDQIGVDFMGGGMVSVSNSVSQIFAPPAGAPPINGTFSLQVTGNAIAGAKGVVVVYFGKQMTINSTAGPTGSPGPPGPAGTSAFLFATDYNFAPQTPGGTLTAGVPATITLMPCPLGVNGTDLNHQLLLFGGTGTAESPPITGGTCTSGAASGTITLTPANNHSGAWQIMSATVGGSEAISAAPSAGAVIYMPMGVSTLTGSMVVVNKHISLRGASKTATTLSFGAGLTQAAIYYVQGGVPYPYVTQYEVSDMTIFSASAQPCVRISGIQEAKRLVHDMYMTGCSIGLKVGDGANADSFDHLIINDVTSEGVSADIGTGGGHLFDNVTIGTVGQSETPTQFAVGFHAYVPTNIGSAGGVTISNTFVSGTGTFGPLTAFLFENQSGVQNPFFVFMQAVVADGTYNTDGIVFRNIQNANIVQSWSVNHAAAPAAAWRIDNSSHVFISGSSTGWAQGQAAFSIQNGSDRITIDDTEFNGPAPSFFFSGTSSTNLHLGAGNHFLNSVLANSYPAFIAALNNSYTTISPIQIPTSSAGILDLVIRNIDAGTTLPNKFIRTNVNGGLEVINNAHSLIVHTIADDGTVLMAGPLAYQSVVFASLGSVAPAGYAKYCSDCITAATCAGAGSGHMAVSNGTNWTCQ